MPKKRKPRKLYAALAVAAGITLLLFEARDLGKSMASGGWFWLLVGILAIVLGLAEFFAKEPPKE